MIDKDKKYFFVFDSSRKNIFYPLYRLPTNNNYYSEDEIRTASLNYITENKLNRIMSMKEKTEIVLCRLHSIGHLCIRRLTEKEKDVILQKEILDEEIRKVEQAIKESIPKELLETKKELDKKLNKLKKTVKIKI